MAATPYTRTRILGNAHNKVRAAAITASTQRASTTVHLLAQNRAGNGSVGLSGAYTGGADTVVDVEVLGGPDGALRASSPVLQGVGNGTLEVQGIDVGAVPQTLRFSLLDAGKASTPALLDFFGVQLAARAPGVVGNSIELSVTRSLVYTDLPYATLQSIPVGSTAFEGAQFDWGQPAGNGAEVPPGALRIAFAGIPQVLRAWKIWEKGRFSYRLDPAVAYEVPENTRVRAVAGNYTLTVTDGTDTETYTAVTMFDFLSQVQARSALLQVLGVVAEDRAPGGQAVTDIPLRTDAHALPVIASVRRSQSMVVGDVSPTAPTENIVVTNEGRATGGAQYWSVRGGVSGQLPPAFTGVPYTAGPVGFTIPTPISSVSSQASIQSRFVPTTRNTGEGLPAICFKPQILGIAATDKEVTFVYKKRPPADCSCAQLPALPVSLQCLGLLPEDEGAMHADVKSRLLDLMQWRAEFLGSNIALAPDNDGVHPDAAVVQMDANDVALVNAVVQNCQDALLEVFEDTDALTEWDAVVVELKAEFLPFADLSNAGLTETPGFDAALLRKYSAAMDVCRVHAGILPKSDASGAQGSPCWRDPGGAFLWEHSEGIYLPMFTNQPYVSVIRDVEGKIVSTQEFGIGLVTQCEHRLKVGDQIIIRISNTHNQAAWSEGDKFTIPVIAAGSAPLTGGTDGSPVQTWTARSSVLGALADWLYDPASPAAYTAGPADVALLPGGIPFEVGDTLAFDIEGGELRWRRDGGAWSTADLYGPPLDLGDGLLLTAAAGPAPSFLPADAWQFRAVATYGTDRLRQPRVGRAFAWDGPVATLDIDLGAAVPVEAVMLALHDIAPGAAVTVSGGLAAPTEWSQPLVLHPVLALTQVDAAHSTAVRYLRVAITGAGAGGSIGWLWAGVGWQPTVTPRMTRSRTWALSRGTGINASALYRGAGVAGSWSWNLDGEEAALLADSYAELFELLDHAARQGAEALAMVPDLDSPGNASLCTIDSEQIEASDDTDWQSTATRAVSLSLPLRPVMV
ncbi:hypothetical protein [Acidovorax sp. Leaf78]|uniref:hypothetical protein n=1 Tax=Acidovorax sp. Leaf78 TaxID=1736237 RepID=UPI0006F76C45|nr:hypothetical protein [Acidovorax sp. Leaf78]KQO23496.1 hypothetical protein ASF16_04860 [Acidovorax sp. Leaf78]